MVLAVSQVVCPVCDPGSGHCAFQALLHAAGVSRMLPWDQLAIQVAPAAKQAKVSACQTVRYNIAQ